jgi:hypothetical protein
MYNQLLNTKWENRLIGYCMGKRVLIVGNALSLFANDYGDLIDSYDVVVRMGKGVPHPEFKQHLGSKTDVWMLSVLRASHYKDFLDAKFKVLNLSQISLYDKDRDTASISKIFLGDEFQLYRDYFLVGNINKNRALIKAAYGKVDKDMRSSQGAIVLSYFTNVIRSYKELHVIGFDFFESRVQYKLDGEINEVSSFHLPVPTLKGTNSNPHLNTETQLNPDKQYILKLRDQGKIILHEMGNVELPPDKAQMLMDKYRRKGELV